MVLGIGASECADLSIHRGMQNTLMGILLVVQIGAFLIASLLVLFLLAWAVQLVGDDMRPRTLVGRPRKTIERENAEMLNLLRAGSSCTTPDEWRAWAARSAEYVRGLSAARNQDAE